MALTGGPVLNMYPAAPRPLPPQFVPHRPVSGGDLTWIGWDGTHWPLTGQRASSAVMLAPGIRGLGMPSKTLNIRPSAFTPGGRYINHHDESREVFLPVRVYGQEGQAWLDYDAKFFNTLRTDRPGWLEYTSTDGAVRRLKMRFVDDSDHVVEHLGAQWGRQTYGLRFVAERPHWTSNPEVYYFPTAVKRNFLGGGAVGTASSGPPFFISAGNTVEQAVVSNPGDHPVKPEIIAAGPYTSLEVGIGGRVDKIDFAVPAGKAILIDGSPDAGYIVDINVQADASGRPVFDPVANYLAVDWASAGVPNGRGDRFRDMTSVSFASIPPGESVPMTIKMVGSGAVQVALTPAWNRAW